MTEDTNLTRPVGALVHALRILRHLAAQGTAEGVTTIARATGVNGSTCYNILRTLVAEGVVIFDPATKTYRLGLGLVELAVGVLGANPGDLIRPELERMATQHGALMCLWHITQNDRIVLIDRAFNPEATRVDLPIGKRWPALIGAVGRVIAVHRSLSNDALKRRFDQFHWQNPPSFAEYLSGIEQARADGYAIDEGQLHIGIDVVASVITDADGRPRYGVSSVTLAGQTTAEIRHHIGRDLASTCQSISNALFSGPHAAGLPPIPHSDNRYEGARNG